MGLYHLVSQVSNQMGLVGVLVSIAFAFTRSLNLALLFLVVLGSCTVMSLDLSINSRRVARQNLKTCP